GPVTRSTGGAAVDVSVRLAAGRTGPLGAHAEAVGHLRRGPRPAAPGPARRIRPEGTGGGWSPGERAALRATTPLSRQALGPVRRIMPETRGLVRPSAALSSLADSPTLGFARVG